VTTGQLFQQIPYTHKPPAKLKAAAVGNEHAMSANETHPSAPLGVAPALSQQTAPDGESYGQTTGYRPPADCYAPIKTNAKQKERQTDGFAKRRLF
jgi:hypothetical protein